MPSRKGSPNKNKQALIALLKAKYPGYHPVLEMAAIANDDVECPSCKDEEPLEDCEVCMGSGYQPVTLEMKFNANKEVAGYVTPKLKAVEHTGHIDSAVEYRAVIKRFDGSIDDAENA